MLAGVQDSRNKEPEKRRLRGRQNRKATQRGHTPDHGTVIPAAGRLERQTSDLRQDGQPAPPPPTFSPGEPGKFSHKTLKCCFCSSQGGEGRAQPGLTAPHPGPGGSVPRPPDSARVEAGTTDSGPALAPWTETG